MRITFVSASLSSGGAERVLVLLAKGFMDRGHTVSLVTLNRDESDFFKVPEGVCRLSLDVSNTLEAVLAFPRLRRSILSTEPNVVISFIDRVNMMTLLATRFLNLPVIVSERVDPEMYPLGLIWEAIRKWTYKFSTKIVVQTDRAASYFLPSFQASVEVIPNPVLSPKLIGEVAIKLPCPFFIAMGRLCHQKGFDLLLKAFAQLKDQHPKWTLIILGEGPLRHELQLLSKELGLLGRVLFLGCVNNPDAYLKHADFFVLSSRFEGFPNALCEAMACGLPVIASDCPSGPSEIICNGRNGLLVQSQNIRALSEAVAFLMSDEVERQRLSDAATEIIDRFNLNKILGLWEALLLKVLSERKIN